MIRKVYSLFDKKALVYGPPVCFGKVGEALRWVCDLMAEPTSTVAKYSDDFQLFELGEYDDNSGEFNVPEKPHLIAAASEYAKKPVVYEPAATEKEK